MQDVTRRTAVAHGLQTHRAAIRIHKRISQHVLRADLAAAQTGQPSTALAGHVNTQYLRGEIDPSAVDDPECDRNSDSGVYEAPDLLRRSGSVLWLQCLLNWYNLRTR